MPFINFIYTLYKTLLDKWQDCKEQRRRTKLITQCWLNIGSIMERANRHGMVFDEETSRFSSIYKSPSTNGAVVYMQQEYDYQKERIARINWLYDNNYTLKGV